MILSIITVICPIFGLLIILLDIFSKWKSDKCKNLKRYVFPLALIFGMFGYNMAFKSGDTNDLLRYFDTISNMVNMSLKNIIALDFDMLYTKDILFYFVSRTGNPHVLPFIVGIIIYAIVFYVLFDMVERSKREFKISEIFMLGIISIGILAPYSVIGNVRCVFSYVLISFAIYRDLVQKKRNLLTLLLYIVPIGLHTSAIIILFIRIVSFLFKKVSKISILIAVMLPTLIEIAHTFVNKFNFGLLGSIVTNAINKAYSYLYWTEGGWATAVENSISSKFNKITGTVFLISIIISIIFLHKNNTKKNEKDISKSRFKLIEQPMVSFLYFVSIFALGCLTIKTGAFWRFEAIVVLFSPVIFIKMLEYNENSKKIFHLFFVFSMLIFAINIVFQIRNLDAMRTLINYISTSGLKVLYELLKGIVCLI